MSDAMAVHELRDYQKRAIESVWNALANTDGNTIAVLPTGTGKSLCIAEFLRKALTEFPGTRVLILHHVRELITQNVAELLKHWPVAPVGIYAAGLGKKDIKAQIVFASIQSIYKKAFSFQEPPFDLVLVDECQLIPRDSNTIYRKFLDDLKTINCHIRIIGWTATAFRTDSGMLHKGDDAIFQSIAYEYNVRDAIDAGYLCTPISRPSSVQIDTSQVGTRAGDFIPNQLENAATDPETVKAMADEIVKNGSDRRGWLFFGSGIHHCELMRDALVERGVTCACIFGSTPAIERDRLIAAYKRQEIRCLSAMNVLLIGFNAPHSDMLAMGRPTKSTGLWIQAVGRVLRTYPGKSDALVLCFGGNIPRHGPIDAIQVKSKAKTLGSVPTKICPSCESAVPIGALQCEDCGFEFPPPVTKVDIQASTGALLTTQIQAEWVDVTKVSYARHPGKESKPPTLRVDYWCGLIKHSEWVCLAHQGYARQKACNWWMRRAPNTIVPTNIEDAVRLVTDLSTPIAIQIKPSGRFHEIVGYNFQR